MIVPLISSALLHNVLQVLQKLPFDSIRKRMSVIVRDQLTDKITLYCKGADSAILTQLAELANQERFGKLLSVSYLFYCFFTTNKH